ncbi:MAG: DUF2062 domain-containing protein [Gammaproteobacteria bacterium]|nr:DUF2062 domain-containing protein [Gammaproteobacteria bacterium]
MPRKFLRRLSAPYRGNQRDAAWYLRPFQVLLAHPVYFSINRRSITGGLAVGVFIGILPFVGHTPVAALAALLLRVNLPVAVLSVWVGNPLTYGPIFYGEYLLGSFLLDLPPTALKLDLPLGELITRLTAAWRPLWIGAITSALLASGTVYLLGNAAWRLMTRGRLKRRAARRPGTRP